MLGYALASGASDWVLGPDDADIQGELLAGWAAAARETEPLRSLDIDAWRARRRAMIVSGRSSMRVGHVDFFARPIGVL